MKYVFRLPFSAVAQLGGCLVCCMWLVGCAAGGGSSAGGVAQDGQTGPKVSAAGRVTDSVDALRIGELILIEYSGNADPPARHEERIKTDGNVTLPSLGQVQ